MSKRWQWEDPERSGLLSSFPPPFGIVCLIFHSRHSPPFPRERFRWVASFVSDQTLTATQRERPAIRFIIYLSLLRVFVVVRLVCVCVWFFFSLSSFVFAPIKRSIFTRSQSVLDVVRICLYFFVILLPVEEWEEKRKTGTVEICSRRAALPVAVAYRAAIARLP